jgi:NCAIR mutase (PurE)-related protein
METSAIARLDHERRDRTGVPEAIFGAGKTVEQNIALVGALYARAGFALASRIPPDQLAALAAAYPDAVLEPLSGALRRGVLPRTGVRIAVVCAGTSDLPVAEEVAFFLDALGHEPVRATDVGVAGIHRLFDVLGELAACRAVIVVAGMEGALPSVVAGLVRAPVIAVPTSVGYGAAFDGLAALLGMLTSCAPGIGVVNIDNGFGAAVLAHKIVSAAS